MKRKLSSGNYKQEKEPELDIKPITKEEKTTNDFEKKALEKLGGSIAFVRGGPLFEENKK